MRSIVHITIAALGVVVALFLQPPELRGQNLLNLFPDRVKDWQRLSTEQDSTTDVGVRSLVLEPNGLFRATFRIQLGKAEKAPEKPDAKYKTRLMTIQFDYRKRAYRIVETTLLDSTEKVVFTSGQLTDAPWKPGSGGSFYSAASQLSPLGSWRVMSTSEAEASQSIYQVMIEVNRFQVGRTGCTGPDYESTSMTREEIAKLTGLPISAFQMSAEKVNVVKIKCSSPDLASEIHILVPTALDRAILLSGGTLYTLQR
jgi:hypothetical protein